MCSVIKRFADCHLSIADLISGEASSGELSSKIRLRSADHGDLVVPRVLSRFGCRSFRVSGTTIWNDLPVDIRGTDITREQFKRSLKI